MTKKKLATILEQWQKEADEQVDWQLEIGLVVIPKLQDEISKNNNIKTESDLFGLVNTITNEIKQSLYYFSENQQPDEWYKISDQDVWYALDGQCGEEDKALAERCINLYLHIIGKGSPPNTKCEPTNKLNT